MTTPTPTPDPTSVLDPSRAYAWCIVPYDSTERTPQERATMLTELGLRGEAWDWRDEHVAQFPAELDALAQRDLELLALWTPHVMPAPDGKVGHVAPEVRGFIAECARRELTPQLWVGMDFEGRGPFEPLSADAQAATVRRYADHVEPLADLAGDHGMDLALYNHMGWAGEPANLVAVIDALDRRGIDNVGITYHQHHGHAHVKNWASVFETMRPHLKALGLSGVVPGEYWGGKKIYPYGRGAADVELARVVVESGWDGPVTVLCHTMDDAELRLRDNLEGLAWVGAQLRGEDADLPEPRIPNPVWPH